MTLLERFAGCDPADPIQRSFILRDLRSLEDSCSSNDDAELASCLGAAATLAGLCASGSTDLDRLRDIFRGLLEAVDLVLQRRHAIQEEARALAAGRHVEAPRPVEEPQTVNEMILGQILVQFGIITYEQAEEAAALGSKPFGQALLQLGYVTPEDLQLAVSFQERLRTPPEERPAPLSPNLLGQILVRRGLVSHEMLEAALQVQAQTGVRLGDALVELRAITFAGLRDALVEQHGWG